MTPSSHKLPRWDLTVVYPGLDSPEFEAGFAAVVQAIDDLVELFDRHGIGLQDPSPLKNAAVRRFEEIVDRFNAVLEESSALFAFIWGFVSTDSRYELAQAKLSELEQHSVKLSLLGTRFTAWVGSLDVQALIDRSESAAAHRFMLHQAKREADHLMAPAEEALAAELELMGSSAWSKLFGNFTSQLMVTVPLEEGPQELPMSEVRNLAYDPDREVRRRAYEAELATWKAAEVPIAASLNSIKGEVNALAKRRKWDSPLDAALFQNHIDRKTVDAMMEAARESFPDFRRYLRAKARALELPALAWFDLFAPLPVGHREWQFREAAAFIVDHFGTYSDRLAGLAQRAFQEEWIDAEPRPGKRDGAFCMWLRKDESRILSNFKPAFDGLRTLAHELGHAYHNLNLAQRTMLQRDTPMALAETASIFCETIIRHSAIRGTDPDEQMAILEDSLQNACQIVVDITSRYLFERNIFEKRNERELSPQEFQELILEAQHETYGDGLDPEALHPYMWAVKGHYYSAGRSFYNYPYMFGLLFGLGLYAHYKEDAEAFKRGYDDLLSSTGMDDAAALAGRFGIDIRDPAFWRSSLDIIRRDIDRFEALVAEQQANPRRSSR